MQVQNQKCYEIQTKIKISKLVLKNTIDLQLLQFVVFLLTFLWRGEMDEEKPSKRRRHILLDAAINIIYFQGFILALHALGL